MTGHYIFTCPICRTIVDYSCMCPEPRDIADFVGHDTVDEAKAHVDKMHSSPAEWKQTHWLLRALGCPQYYRSIYADWRIGGGWDGWEWRR